MKDLINVEELDIPDDLMEKWQGIVDIMSTLIGIPAGLIMRLKDPEIEVFISSKSKGNPYHPGDKEQVWDSGLYCETVIKTKNKLLVPNALRDDDWKNNPDIKLGMISYLGYPIILPTGGVFGTICVLDSKENEYGKQYENLLLQFKELVESHLYLLYQSIILKKTIADRKLAEEALRESEVHLVESNQILAGVLEHTHILTAFLDPQFNFVWVNHAYAATDKHEVFFFPGKNHFDLYPHEENQAIFQRVVDTGEPFFVAAKPFEYPDQPERGVTYWDWSLIPIKDDIGKVTGLVFTLAEVTGRIRAEKALQESEKRFRLLTELLVDTVYEFDPKGKFTYVNEAGVRMLGYSKDEVLGNIQVRDTISKEDHARSREDIGEIFKGKTIVAERTFIRKDGTTFIGEIHSGPIYKGKDVVGVRGVLRDITERKEMEAHLKQAHKMESIGILAGGIAHQFNNVLYTITGNIDLLEMDFLGDENVANYAKKIKTSVRRMTLLTAQLLAYARGGKYQAKTISLSDLVRETVPLLKHTIDSAINVDTDLPRDILHVKADMMQLQMVLSAVLTNASEAMEGKGGHIRVTCQKVAITDDTTKDFPGLKPGNYACLTVTDDGKGMDEETRTRIFEPFFTTKFEGRGLGMAAAYGIVKNHDGWISVDSELDKGTIVKIYLPAVETPVKEDAKPKPKTEWIKGKGTILVIDDEEAVMDVSRAMLERMGYHVLEAKTGQEAIDVVKSFDGDIDLAMLDILLPGMGGESIYPLLMKSRPNLKVIVFSGYSIDGPAQKILDAGAEDFIQKPFTMAQLSEKLKKILGSEQ